MLLRRKLLMNNDDTQHGNILWLYNSSYKNTTRNQCIANSGGWSVLSKSSSYKATCTQYTSYMYGQGGTATSMCDGGPATNNMITFTGYNYLFVVYSEYYNYSSFVQTVAFCNSSRAHDSWASPNPSFVVSSTNTIFHTTSTLPTTAYVYLCEGPGSCWCKVLYVGLAKTLPIKFHGYIATT